MGISLHLHPSLVLACFCKPVSPFIRAHSSLPPSSRRSRFIPPSFCSRLSSVSYQQSPADFAIALYTQQDLLARLSDAKQDLTLPAISTAKALPPTTRTRYARIRAVHAGVPTPGIARSPPAQEGEKNTVAFILVLEPTYLGVLPARLLSTFGFLVLILLAAVWLVAPRIIASMEPFAREAREDCLKTGMTETRTRKER